MCKAVNLENYINVKKYDPPVGELMLKKLAIIFIAIIMMVVGSAILVYGQEGNIEITTESEKISVVENYEIDIISNGNVSFWIQNGAANITILIDGNSIEYTSIGDNIYSCDLSGVEYTYGSNIQVMYSLDKETSIFEKTLLYNITSLSITFDGVEIYAGSNLASGSSLNVALRTTTQVQTITKEKTIEKVPTWYYAIIVVLIILVALSFVFPSKEKKTQKSTTKKQVRGSESEELLTTKKALLMEVLKDIEKQHRAKKISDDTYNKLKDQYKQDAVEAMKQLEDIKSKVK